MMGTRSIIAALVAISLFAYFGCQKKIHTPPTPVETTASPEEPIQKLAWDASKRVSRGLQDLAALEFTVQINRIAAGAEVSENAAAYFKGSLENHLKNVGVKLEPSGNLILNGNLYGKEKELVFAFIIQRAEAPFLSDSVSVPFDARVENTLAQFESAHPAEHSHEIHREMPVPSPLAELQEAPLDVSSLCPSPDDSSSCSLLLLYPDRLVERNWKTGSQREIHFSATNVRSRAPSGKILSLADGILVMNNNLSTPLQYNQQLGSNDKELPAILPKAEPGRNDFALADGYFYDFEYLPTKGIAVVDTTYYLSVAEGGALIRSTDRVGATLCVALPAIYTSAHSLPGQKDAILKFSYENGTLKALPARPVDGEILDLTLSDLNLDAKQELLVTLRNERGIFVEVFEP